jgi:hypothetical protein
MKSTVELDTAVDIEDRLIELSRKAAVIAGAASSLSRTSSPDVAAGIVDLVWEASRRDRCHRGDNALKKGRAMTGRSTGDRLAPRDEPAAAGQTSCTDP